MSKWLRRLWGKITGRKPKQIAHWNAVDGLVWLTKPTPEHRVKTEALIDEWTDVLNSFGTPEHEAKREAYMKKYKVQKEL